MTEGNPLGTAADADMQQPTAEAFVTVFIPRAPAGGAQWRRDHLVLGERPPALGSQLVLLSPRRRNENGVHSRRECAVAFAAGVFLAADIWLGKR